MDGREVEGLFAPLQEPVLCHVEDGEGGEEHLVEHAQHHPPKVALAVDSLQLIALVGEARLHEGEVVDLLVAEGEVPRLGFEFGVRPLLGLLRLRKDVLLPLELGGVVLLAPCKAAKLFEILSILYFVQLSSLLLTILELVGLDV